MEMNVKPLREGIGSYALCAPRLCGGQPGGTESVVPNEANLPGAGRPREIRSTKPEIRNKLEKQMIQTDQSAPNEPNFKANDPNRPECAKRTQFPPFLA